MALPARAKLNLSLSVRGLLPGGYHQIRTLMQAISLHDLLIASHGETGLQVIGGDVPVEGNLVLRAHAALEAAAARRLPTAFRLVKRIPAGAGLGGGSSDAAAALRATATLHGVVADLEAVAAGVGADVPFFLRGGAAIAEGRGEILSPAPDAAGWWAVAWPGLPISTGSVYAAWSAGDGGPDNELAAAALRVEPRLAAFAAGLGPGWRMTGSGSAFFHAAATRSEAERLASRLECWTAVAHSAGAWR